MKNEMTINFNGQNYVARYNEQTGYYEIDIVAPNTGGIYKADICYTDLFNQEYEDRKVVQIYAKEKIKIETNKVFMWIFDYTDFSVKDIVEISDYEINIDEETNSSSMIRVLKQTTAKSKDIIAVKKNNEVVYWGIIENIQNENGKKIYEYTTKYITNIFDRNIKLENENLIREKGVEDFIADAIERNFINSVDTFINKSYLKLNIKTHTKKQISVSNVENGIYNLHTWQTNCTQNYDIVYSFSIENKKFVITIESKTIEKELIDTQAQQISNYTEVFETDIVAKVIVIIDYTKNISNVENEISSLEERVQDLNKDISDGKTDAQEELSSVQARLNKLKADKTELLEKKDKNEDYFTLYLLSDRTTTTDMNDINRADGKIETLYAENYEDAEQTALDKIKTNTYNHNITFNYYNQYIRVGTPIAIKTKETLILDTYISAIKITTSKFYEYTCGNIRVKLIDKLMKERK